jgi:CrcB protein
MGGLTTYSAFSYETVRLMEVQAWRGAALNVIVTTALCLGLCVLGMTAGRALIGPRG